jgi:hypothetical protein
MGETGKRRNFAIWLGLLLTLLGPLSSGLVFIGFPAEPIPWIGLALPTIGVVFVLIGLWRAFARSEIYRGKIAGSIVAVLSLLLLAASVAFFRAVRHIPPQSAGTPKVGQQVADFTLPDSNGHPVSLMQLFSASASNPTPKAVLLVFYRGYW